MARTLARAVLAAVLLAAGAQAEEAARPRREALDLPPAWQAVGAQARLAAKRAAEADADAQLVERIHGLNLDAQTTVRDLALTQDELLGDLAHAIRGIRTREVVYAPDLTVEVVREVDLRDVVETVRRTLRRVTDRHGVKEQELDRVTRETREKTVAARGSGAVPGSAGHRLLMARRAAQLDAYRKLAEEIGGIALSRQTQVRGLLLARDHVATQLAMLIKGARPVDIVYRPDGSCEVTVCLTLREVIETIDRTTERFVKDGKVDTKVDSTTTTESRDRILKVTGAGTGQDQWAPEQAAVGAAPVEVAAPGPPAPLRLPATELELIRQAIGRTLDERAEPPAHAGGPLR